ncbi:gliding motility-associated C-terminal domain-containing protein [Cnuella takakiae]|uniref:Gliding motility-associated C-terminal domain-containing protein n=1 Tax=Cnuella takakiae TaxID=1302690 RepID=A0A1M4T9I6_9BACT|nr:PKD domain-containing protein [Cnuella takakiae]OLY90697.1 hypothetical protein BUE76_01375 [Cnuella takakiae]SHE41166.1 gliding motility-associated C-terminal domain-containing protein [Cnuella takakiae]
MKKTLGLILTLILSVTLYSQTIVASGPLCGASGTTTLRVQNPVAGATYKWKKDGAEIPTATASTYTATASGSYEVIETLGGTPTTSPAFVLAESSVPVADFSFANNLCANTAVAFTNTSTGTGLSYAWNFGDAAGATNTSTLASPTHRFINNVIGNNNQNFTVRLTVTNADGCTDEEVKTVVVKQVPSTDLEGSGGASSYDNKTYFKQCTGVNSYLFNFSNQSTTANTSYKIVWGDNTPDFTGSSFGIQTHSYNLGTKDLKFEVTGQNGCVASAEYAVFVGSNPAVGLGNPGNTTICTGSTLTFPISSTSANAPGTSYKVNFNDGTPDINYTHPAPADVTHTFNRASCNTNSGSNPVFNNSFSATIIASNPCQSSSATVVPIYVSERPQPVISTPKDSVCTGLDVPFSNSGTIGNYINGSNCVPSKSVWSVTPATGWVVTSGQLGNDNSNTDPSLWMAGSATINLRFSAPGTYTIKLKTGNPLCGTQEVTKTICVNEPPVASFTLDNTIGCGPLAVATTNTSGSPLCGTYRYLWTVTYSNPQNCGTSGSGYSFTGNTSNGSVSPQFSFVNPGEYTIGLQVINPGGLCTSAVFTRTVTVKDKPRVSIGAIANICQNGSISPAAAINNCYGTSPLTYAWSFAGGAPASAATATPGSIQYSGTGQQTVVLTVGNECGNTAANQVFNITAASTVTNPGNKVLCAGSTQPQIVFTGSGTAYNWTNSNTAIGLAASGNGTISGFTVANSGTTPQVATITVTPLGSCPGAPVSFTITVNPRPLAPVVSTPVIYCQNTTAPPLTATAAAGNSLTWYTNSNLTGGSATAPTPLTNTVVNTPYYITQTDGTCISPIATIMVQVQAAITGNSIGSSHSICLGSTANSLNPSQSPSGGLGSFTYQWQSSTDGGATWANIGGAASSSYNPGALTATTHFRRLVSSGSCVDNPSNVVVVTVQPALSGFGLNTTTTPICTGPSPVVIDGQTATGGGGAITYTWQESANGSTGWTIIAGATGEDYTVPAISAIRYYQRITQGANCSATSTVIQVQPGIVQSNINAVAAVCAGSPSARLQASQAPTGGQGNYGFQWQSSADGTANWTNIAGATQSFYDPGVLGATTYFRRMVSSGVCADNASNVVEVLVAPAITDYALHTGNLVVCAGQVPSLLDGKTATGGGGSVTYQWQVSADGGATWANIAGATSEDFQPAVLTATRHYKRIAKTSICSVESEVIEILVNPVPVLAAPASQVLCKDANFGGLNFSATPAGTISYAWTNSNTAIGLAASGSGPLPAFTAINTNAGKVPEVANITITSTRSANGISCAGTPVNFTLTVLPLVTVQPIADITLCSGGSQAAITPVHDAGNYTNSVIQYQWTVTGTGINLNNGSGAVIPAFTATNNGTTDLVATITLTPLYQLGAASCPGTPISFQVTVKPGTPMANAGPDQNLCAASSYTMQATAPAFGSGQWQLQSGPQVTIVDPANPTTVINGLQLGNTYVFHWTVTGAPGCAPTQDDITIDIKPALTNTITTTPLTICSGQNITIAGQPATGGNGTPQYEWQFSTNRAAWSPINGQTSASLVYTPLQSGFVRRMVRSLPCTDPGQEVAVTVQAAVSNNTISASQTLCIGNPTQLLVGSDPAGANGAFLYQWEQSANGVNWTIIPGAVSRDYQPGTLSATTHFRRIVASNLCAGPQSNTSQAVIITINPDAVASFRTSRDTACAPFAINSSVVVLQPDATRNGSYQWYANGNLLGSGNSFPGYVLQGSNDFVDIKLKAISRYGCKADSMERRLYTYTNPQPAFTLNTTGGCGPLTVQFSNTTPNAGQYRFYWNFGNGRSSTLAQPGAILFASNPSFGDTTYTVTLHAISACDTFRVSQQVRVGSVPKALFTPSKTVGCSPMQVSFRNTSRGIGNSYTWDFGDGTIANRSNADTISHTFITSVRDTFFVKLVATNTCGTDTARFAVVVSPNTIVLDFAVNGNEQAGCTPHTVRFINNTRGAASFRWDFGDGDILSTTRNQDTVSHLYRQPGNYLVRLFATNGCTDTSSTEAVTVYPKPKAAFNAGQYTLCIGEGVQFQNNSDSATGYAWQFGDGATSTATNPVHQYRNPGLYTVLLTSLRANSAGSVCPDSVAQQINVVRSQAGWFTAFDTVSACAPLTVTFTNRNTPATSAVWNFGDGTTATGDVVTHTFKEAGIYAVQLVAQAPGGCVYQTQRTVTLNGPRGVLQYSNAILCNDNAVRFQVQASGTDTLVWNFGDGVVLKTTTNVVYHAYANGGKYRPSVTLLNRAGCSVLLQGSDSISVDKVKADFTFVEDRFCGGTTLQFREGARAYSGQAAATWKFGDGATGAGVQPQHTYVNSGTFPVQLITTSMGGCRDTLTRFVPVKVNDIPAADIIAQALACTRSSTQFRSSIRAVDAIGSVNWSLSNGVQSNTAAFDYTFARAGVYNMQLAVGTVNGCYDTASQTITINTSPDVSVSADKRLCLGEQTALSATGATRYSWSPIAGLSCTNCADPIAAPRVTTTYVVTGTNSAGCSQADTVLVSVIQPLQLRVSPSDSICIGSSTLLQASGATTYRWTPATGLSNAAIANPLARPDATTIYRVVGYDGFNCFTDTAFVTVAVGTEPTISLGPDLTLSTGTQLPLRTVVQNGPIRTWEWSPATDLSCTNCPLPTAYIRKDITYTVKGTTPYGCVDTDTLNIKVFCEGSQVFIPNAFTPDGDGVNDILMVRGKGIAMVKTFRVFNRWGEVVFEKSSFRPNDPTYGWDGKVRGVAGQPEVYVYTAEVVCDNGGTYTYKGNTSLLK